MTKREIFIKSTKSGKRAYYWSTRAFRTFAMPLAQAEMEIATGEAVELLYMPMSRAMSDAVAAGLPISR